MRYTRNRAPENNINGSLNSNAIEIDMSKVKPANSNGSVKFKC
jgi:hypothetical protein